MISASKKILDMFMVLCIIFGTSVIKGENDADIKKICDNITNGLLSGSLSPFAASDLKTADEIIENIVYDEDGDCYFKDVNYHDTQRSNWTTQRHINRTEKITILYRLEENSEKKEEYKQYIFRLLDYWIKNDFQSLNWWYNKLSNPNVLGEIGILMKDDLSGSRLKKLAELIGRGCFTVNLQTRDYTGANATDIAMSTIKFGALMNSKRTIKWAVKIVSRELEYSEDEGIRKDATFFQHGNRLYMGGYGMVFIGGINTIHDLLEGSSLGFTSEQLEPLAAFICDGLKYMSFGSTLDPITVGRSYSRYHSRPLGGTANALYKLCEIEEMPRKDEITAYADDIKNNEKNDYGVRLYNESGFIVINNSDFYFSFLGGNKGIYYSEVINSENILGYNSSYPGVTTIFNTGDELLDISPIYDYSMVAGTTAVYETDEELLKYGDFTYREVNGTFGNAKADGAAVCFAKTEHEGISSTITCFATDNAAFILGAGIKDEQSRPMNTTINQCFYKGSYSSDGTTVIHNNIKYARLDGGKITVKAEHKSGNWQRNNLSVGNIPAEGDIFTAYFENTGSYAYSVMNKNTNEEIEIIMNTEKIQAVVLPDGRIAAAFAEKSSFEYNGKTYSEKAGTVKIYEK